MMLHPVSLGRIRKAEWIPAAGPVQLSGRGVRDGEVNRKRNSELEVMARHCSPRRAQKTWGEHPTCHRMSDQGCDLRQCVLALKASGPCLMLGHKKKLEAEPTICLWVGFSQHFGGMLLMGSRAKNAGLGWG